MINQCANPNCSVPLRYLREGRLFQFEVKTTSFSANQEAKTKKVSRGLTHFWLCGACSSSMTLTFDPLHGVEVVPIMCFNTPEILDRAIVPQRVDRMAAH